MKSKLFMVLLWALNVLPNMAISQTLNWNTLDDTKHIVHANFGLDYAFSYGMGYGYKLNTNLPVVLNANFSMPAGQDRFDDFKTKIGAQFLVMNKSNFRASIAVAGIYRHHQTHLLRLQNLGGELKGTFGYYKKAWFLAAEVGFDKAIATHFKHSLKYKEEIYPAVVDGWYNWGTGGNVYYGFQGGYSFKSVDVTMHLGKVMAQDFKTMPVLPFYLILGVNYRPFL